jgi:hypothetical protein
VTALDLLAAREAATETQILRVLGDAPEVLRTPALLDCWKRLPAPAALTLACSDLLGVDGEEDVVCLLYARWSASPMSLAMQMDRAVRVAELGSTYLVALNNMFARQNAESGVSDTVTVAAMSELLARCGRVRKAMGPCTRRRLPGGPFLVSVEVTELPERIYAQTLWSTYHKGFTLKGRDRVVKPRRTAPRPTC